MGTETCESSVRAVMTECNGCFCPVSLIVQVKCHSSAVGNLGDDIMYHLSIFS